MNTNDQEQQIRVTIFGQEYTLRGRGQSESIEEVAALVDQKMKEISVGTSTVDSQRVAILAALNIADEYQRYRAEKEKDEEVLAQKTEKCCRILDAAMDKP